MRADEETTGEIHAWIGLYVLFTAEDGGVREAKVSDWWSHLES